jgi:hypothetical protein
MDTIGKEVLVRMVIREVVTTKDGKEYLLHIKGKDWYCMRVPAKDVLLGEEIPLDQYDKESYAPEGWNYPPQNKG